MRAEGKRLHIVHADSVKPGGAKARALVIDFDGASVNMSHTCNVDAIKVWRNHIIQLRVSNLHLLKPTGEVSLPGVREKAVRLSHDRTHHPT